jgi:hypothetical protein
MKQTTPTTPAEWFTEIGVAIEDARAAKPFGKLIGQPITQLN